MKPEIKAKWVAALRSGEYKQGKELLYNEETNAYCCWGVLRHLMDPTDTEREHCIGSNYLTACGLPPLFDTSPLENMNDGNVTSGAEPQSFAVIADYIEANL